MSQRDLIIEKARENLVAFYEKQSPQFARDLERLIGRGVFDLETIKANLSQYDGVVIESLGQFDELFKLSERMFKLGEIPFLWTAQNEAFFETMIKAKSKYMINSFKEVFLL